MLKKLLKNKFGYFELFEKMTIDNYKIRLNVIIRWQNI